MAQNSEKWNKTIQAYKTYIRLEKNLSPNSVEAYIRDVTIFENFVLRMYDVPPTAVEEYMVERFLTHLLERKHKKSSQARELSGVKSFFNYLLVTDKIESSPTEFITAPKSSRTLPDVLTVEEGAYYCQCRWLNDKGASR
jgi:integrase/recombinase XerD